MLYKILCLHPETAYISNWVARYPSRTSLASLNRFARSRPERRRAVWFGEDSNAYVYGRKRGLRARMFPMPVEGEPVYAACGIPQDTELDPTGLWEEGRAFRRSVSAIAASSGGTVFVNKRIANNLRIPFLTRGVPGRAVRVARARRARRRAVALARRLVARQQALVVRRHAARVGGRRGRPVGGCARATGSRSSMRWSAAWRWSRRIR